MWDEDECSLPTYALSPGESDWRLISFWRFGESKDCWTSGRTFCRTLSTASVIAHRGSTSECGPGTLDVHFRLARCQARGLVGKLQSSLRVLCPDCYIQNKKVGCNHLESAVCYAAVGNPRRALFAFSRLSHVSTLILCRQVKVIGEQAS